MPAHGWYGARVFTLIAATRPRSGQWGGWRQLRSLLRSALNFVSLERAGRWKLCFIFPFTQNFGKFWAGDGNRTHVVWLETRSTTIVLHPRRGTQIRTGTKSSQRTRATITLCPGIHAAVIHPSETKPSEGWRWERSSHRLQPAAPLYYIFTCFSI